MTYAVASSSCSAAGSDSSSILVSSFSRTSSASFPANALSASLIAFARASLELSSSFKVAACCSRDGTAAGLVEDFRAVSKIPASAV